MTEHEASRTLVKSPPELWEECSDAASLARHLGEFKEIRITRVEPETAVAWEGEGVSGTVRLEPSGWGTRVTLTASADAEEPVSEDVSPPPPLAAAPPDPPSSDPPGPAPPQQTRADLLTRVVSLFRSRRTPLQAPPSPPPPLGPPEPATAAEPPGAHEPATALEPPPPASLPGPEPQSAAEPEPQPPDEAADADSAPIDAGAALTAALDSLGQAHHRPFSRA